jgi:hypothetical protein
VSQDIAAIDGADNGHASTPQSEARIAEAVEMMRAALLDLTIAEKLKAVERLQGWVSLEERIHVHGPEARQ